jgi:hypothetical protein
MKKAGLLSLCFVMATPVLVLGALALDVEVQIAPHMLLLWIDQSGEVAVHTDIPYSLVDPGSVALAGFPAVRTKADDCGNFVGFFDEAEIKSVVAVPSYELVFTGFTVDGEPFSGSDTVLVKDK